MEIQKYDGPTDRLTWIGARDACASKNVCYQQHHDQNVGDDGNDHDYNCNHDH